MFEFEICGARKERRNSRHHGQRSGQMTEKRRWSEDHGTDGDSARSQKPRDSSHPQRPIPTENEVTRLEVAQVLQENRSTDLWKNVRRGTRASHKRKEDLLTMTEDLKEHVREATKAIVGDRKFQRMASNQ